MDVLYIYIMDLTYFIKAKGGYLFCPILNFQWCKRKLIKN